MLLLAADNPTDHVTDLPLLVTAGGTPLLTMHMITMLAVAGACVLVMMKVANAIATGPKSEGNERYITKGRLAQLAEAIIVYLRDEMLIPVLGEEHTKRYLPYLMTLFFFVLYMNLLGLVPHGATATGNLAVTAGLAVISVLVIEISGFLKLGTAGYMRTMFPKVPGLS